jgi:hypothetical protein
MSVSIATSNPVCIPNVTSTAFMMPLRTKTTNGVHFRRTGSGSPASSTWAASPHEKRTDYSTRDSKFR